MAGLLGGLEIPGNERVLVGLSTGDDAGVYLLDDNTALVQTLDFITPVVDDPFLYGQIAAANSLSDVYAMGGVPLTAMNILAFPSALVDSCDAGLVLKGAALKLAEAGAALVGGHTVENPEMLFGLSVTGTVHPKRIITNRGAKPGDRLILTKPLGSGMISTALKGGLAKKEDVDEAVASMTLLNKEGSRLMAEAGVSAATDITGFGLVGHALGMVGEGGVDLQIDWPLVPLFKGAGEAFSLGLIPKGAYENLSRYREFLGSKRADAEDVFLMAADPQTSGGLLISCPAPRAGELLRRLMDGGYGRAAIIGEAVPGSGRIEFI